MSRIGKQPINVPQSVDVKILGNTLFVKGPKGELALKFLPVILVTFNNNKITVNVKNPEDKKQKALWGLYRNLIRNLITGVTEGFSKQLEISGIGYRASVSKGTLMLNIGYSHPVEFKIPEGIDIKVEKNIITVTGIDKQKVGQVAAEIRAFRKPEPYKGKGIKYVSEVIRKKAGKAAVKTE